MLYTSYFANIKNLPKDSKLYYISNSALHPCEQIGCVVPSWQLVHDYKDGLVNEEEYRIVYLNMLNIRREEILKQINELPDNSVLLCYEKPPKFCHRHILADWLRNNGIEIKEYA